MRGEVHLGIKQMRTFADARHRGREYLVAAFLKKISHAPPNPSATPSAMDKNEGLRRSLRFSWRNAPGQCGPYGYRDHIASSCHDIPLLLREEAPHRTLPHSRNV